MKKGDKLFKDEFVHFRWDDSLEGKMGFMEDGIGLLERKVADGVMDTIHKADSIGFHLRVITGLAGGSHTTTRIMGSSGRGWKARRSST